MKPRGPYLLLEPNKQESTDSGIVLPDNNFVQEKAKVLGVGGDVQGIKKGDWVFYKSWATDEVKIGNDDPLIFLHVDQVLGTDEK